MASRRDQRLLSIDAELARDNYYVASAPPGERFAALQGEHRADVAIVGGGLAGLSAALTLRKRGRRVVLLEAHRLGSGASGRNGGQAIHGLACDQAVIERQLGVEAARRVWDMSIEALDLIRTRCLEHDIACDWRSGFLGVAVNDRKARELLSWAETVVQRYDYPLTPVTGAALATWIDSPRYRAAVHDPRSGHLHPLKYVQGLARAAHAAGAQMHEASPVRTIRHGTTVRLETPEGTVHADQVLLAGNVYLPALLDGADAQTTTQRRAIDSRIMPVGTYIVCTESMDPARCARLIPSGSAVCDNNFVLDYFRPTADHRMLYGGRVSYSMRTPADMAEGLRRRMVHTFPQLADLRVAHAWGGFVDITMNRAPDFSRIGAYRNVYCLQGFSGHGLALTGLAGQIAAEAMTGDADRFDLFARLQHRPFPGGPLWRTPSLVLGMLWYRLKDLW